MQRKLDLALANYPLSVYPEKVHRGIGIRNRDKPQDTICVKQNPVSLAKVLQGQEVHETNHEFLILPSYTVDENIPAVKDALALLSCFNKPEYILDNGHKRHSRSKTERSPWPSYEFARLPFNHPRKWCRYSFHVFLCHSNQPALSDFASAMGSFLSIRCQ